MAADTPTGDDEPADRPPEAARGAGRGGEWLTYRYRLGGEGTPEATGTMKAPSFLSAARRILARRLGSTIGPAPAYLRLRAAGEEEVLLRVARTGVGAGGGLHLEVVPGHTYQFAPPPSPAGPALNDPPPTPPR